MFIFQNVVSQGSLKTRPDLEWKDLENGIRSSLQIDVNRSCKEMISPPFLPIWCFVFISLKQF